MPVHQGHQAFSIIGGVDPTRQWPCLGCYTSYRAPPGWACQIPRRWKSVRTLAPLWYGLQFVLMQSAEPLRLRVTFIRHILIGNHSQSFLFIISLFIYRPSGLSVYIQTQTVSHSYFRTAIFTQRCIFVIAIWISRKFHFINDFFFKIFTLFMFQFKCYAVKCSQKDMKTRGQPLRK